MASLFLEDAQIVQAIVPVDLASADNTGDFVSLINYRRLLFVVSTGIGSAGNDIVIDANQATAADGTGVKALTKITRIHHKVGATAISAVGTFTEVEQTAAASYDSVGIDEAENEALLVIEVNAEDLDTDNGFEWVRFDVADVGTGAHLGSALYILLDPRYSQATPPSAIA